jgi:cell cycle sensor histidine kinase DivJ
VEHRVVDHLFHDFKGGLATVIMGVEAVRDGMWGKVQDSQNRWLMKAVLDCEYMVSLIDDFRDLMQMEEGTYPAEPEVLDIAGCLDALREAITDHARQRRIDVTFRCPEAPPRAEFRAQLLPRLLNRLFGVFLDCTQSGGRLLAEGSLVRDRAGEKLRFDLYSEGVESDPDLLETVFDKVRQAEVGLKVGRGYSMLFCRESARILGGTVRLHPWPGRGTRAELLVPFSDMGDSTEGT